VEKTKMSGLNRSSGPRGFTDIDGRRFQLGGWELFEGDPASPHQCQGWFTCRDQSFEARKNTALHLTLIPREGGFRELDVTITVNDKPERLWQFVACP
jgi:hypothetical protein